MNSRFLYTALISIFAIAMIIGCAPKPVFDEMQPDAIYRYLVEQFEKEKYFSASEGLAYFTLHYSGHAVVDSAQYMLGQCHFHMDEYLLAADAFEELSRRFPSSPLVPEAMFMIGQCFWEVSPKFSLDQAYTLRAIDALQAFIDYFPNHTLRVAEAQVKIGACREKLAHKQYSNGLIYQKMKDFSASIIYFQGVVDQYYDTPWAAKSGFMIAESFRKNTRFDDAIEGYRLFLQKYPNHEWSTRAKVAIDDTIAQRSVSEKSG
ncbi:MAG: outer membrane protein assembly factor BamD [Calditrichaeota bacterium]|jgi:outer membrane protein assembly factor BamD|nr:outer membrane protein assembly factor BamD [Calditrichota bacterium]MBT7789734.1 outer membrane protein assembly factor BamD [Calditrichota bacterium]